MSMFPSQIHLLFFKPFFLSRSSQSPPAQHKNRSSTLVPLPLRPLLDFWQVEEALQLKSRNTRPSRQRHCNTLIIHQGEIFLLQLLQEKNKQKPSEPWAGRHSTNNTKNVVLLQSRFKQNIGSSLFYIVSTVVIVLHFHRIYNPVTQVTFRKRDFLSSPTDVSQHSTFSSSWLLGAAQKFGTDLETCRRCLLRQHDGFNWVLRVSFFQMFRLPSRLELAAVFHPWAGCDAVASCVKQLCYIGVGGKVCLSRAGAAGIDGRRRSLVWTGRDSGALKRPFPPN